MKLSLTTIFLVTILVTCVISREKQGSQKGGIDELPGLKIRFAKGVNDMIRDDISYHLISMLNSNWNLKKETSDG